ncbi:polyprenol monophosphomannose synthase [Haloechinothrix sp. LS1_15]|uniref:polyprenol monophosphomannose synthase n=1 Tax=Haloechinothrix sp. LS1_15 TaxID=2652248 RepID=UPI0029464143|nr:polyprenol monophosphomannose synthase [Haloechinothrix sp. LS1_15]MDV6014009.1 polyprenol monophosphomannose synthase [Haloechinothrix sp. LS1_15]
MDHVDAIGPVLVVVPTYNERDNIGPLLTKLLAMTPAVDVLVVDDASPDGTGEIADALAASDERAHVLHRERKSGLGAAYVAGFRWGLARGYAALVEMDADGSHDPGDLPRLLDALREHDVVLGSRYVPGGNVLNWPGHRRLLSRGGNVYSRMALGVRINDITSGFRAYRREVLDALPLDEIASQGYCFQIDLAWRSVTAGYSVAEVPITFVERETGNSKMSGAIVREAMLNVGVWGLRHRATQLRGLLARAVRR